MKWGIDLNLDETVIKLLGIEMKSLDKEIVQLTMPVDERTRQPAGFLHGGANVLLAETAASIGSYLNINPDKHHVFGLEINANHIKSKRDGYVIATARPLHIGRSTMVWDIKITDEEETLICVSRCTIGVVPKK